MPPRPGVISLAIAVACAAPAGAGCSLMFIDRAPREHASLSYFDCTSSRWAPTADLVGGALFGVGALGAASEERSADQRQAVVVSAALAAGMLTSALHGLKVIDECQAAKAALAARLMRPANGRLGVSSGGGGGGGPRGDPWIGRGDDLLIDPAPPSGAERSAPAEPAAPEADPPSVLPLPLRESQPAPGGARP